MSNQDWTPVVIKRKLTKKEQTVNGNTTIAHKDSDKGERLRLSKLENDNESSLKQKRVSTTSIQQLIKKRIEMKLNQDGADNLCCFPKHTFKDIECGKYIPSPSQRQKINREFNIVLAME